MLSGEYGRITRQLGNIKNNIYFLFKILCSKFSYYGSRLRDFWYDTQKKSEKYARDNGLKGWNEVAVWREFKPPFISRDIWAAYIEHVMSKRFSRRPQSRAVNRNWQIHGSVTTHTGGSIPFSAHAKRIVRLI